MTLVELEMLPINFKLDLSAEAMAVHVVSDDVSL